MTRDELEDNILCTVPEEEAKKIMGWVDDYVADLTEDPPRSMDSHPGRRTHRRRKRRTRPHHAVTMGHQIHRISRPPRLRTAASPLPSQEGRRGAQQEEKPVSVDHPCVVLLPGGQGNPTSHYRVVYIREWVAVLLGEKEHYVFASDHENYASAALERDQLNHRPEEYTPCPSPTTIGVIFRKSELSSTKPTDTTSSTSTVTTSPAKDTSKSASATTSPVTVDH